MTRLRSIALSTLCTSIALFSVQPAHAITGTYQPDPIHTYVGLAVFYDANGDFVHRCSGTLISPSVFLTAGHCTDATTGVTSARIYFQQEAGANYDPTTQHDPVTGYPDTCISGDPLCVVGHELYNYGFNDFVGLPNTHDAGIIVLDAPVTFTTQFASVAAPGALDALSSKRGILGANFTISGYGVSDNWPKNQPVESFRVRLMATTKLNNLNNHWTDGYNIQISGSQGNNRGGICSGDSGGPILWDSSNIVVGVTSFGKHEQCLGNGYEYRIDQQAVLDWILGIAATVGEDQQINVVPIF
jgi:Trypsin